MASKDTSGWKSLGVNDPTKYQATLELNQTSGRRNPLTGQTDSKQKVIYITDRATGSYDAYAEGAFGSRSLIYQYNPSKLSPTIVDQNQYDKLLTEQGDVKPVYESKPYMTCFGIDIYEKDDQLFSEDDYAKTL